MVFLSRSLPIPLRTLERVERVERRERERVPVLPVVLRLEVATSTRRSILTSIFG